MKVLNTHTASLHLSGPSGERFMVAPGHEIEVPDKTDIQLFIDGGFVRVIEETKTEPVKRSTSKSKGGGDDGSNESGDS